MMWGCPCPVPSPGAGYYLLGMLRDAEKQFKSALRQQEVVSTYLALAKVYIKLDQPASALGACHGPSRCTATYAAPCTVRWRCRCRWR
jgi:hypothetical protein